MSQDKIAVRLLAFEEEGLVFNPLGVVVEALMRDTEVALAWEPVAPVGRQTEELGIRLNVEYRLPSAVPDQPPRKLVQYRLLGRFEVTGLRAIQQEEQGADAGATNELLLPYAMITAFLDIVVGAARGFLGSHLRGTPLGTVVIPMVDVSQLAALRLPPPAQTAA